MGLLDYLQKHIDPFDENANEAQGLLGTSQPQRQAIGSFQGPTLQPTPPFAPGGTVPNVTGAQMPQFPAPPPAQQPPSLLDRLKHGIGGALERVSDSIRPKAPLGYEGLLTPEEIKSARPSLIHTLIGAPDAPGASEQYNQNLEGILGRKVGGMQLQQQLAQQQRQQELVQRLQQIPNFSTMTPEQQRAAVTGIYGEMLKAGDFKDAAGVASAVGAMQGANRAPALQHVDAGGQVLVIDPATGKVVQTYEKTPTKRDPNSPTTAEMRREQMLFTRQAQLSDDFRQGTKQYATVADMIGTAQVAGQRAMSGDPQSQQALVFAFMKLLDPGSTVREGEYASAKNAGSVPEKIWTEYNQIKDGRLLAPTQVKRMLDQISAQAVGWKRRFDPILRRYTNTARRAGVDPNDVAYDYFQTLDIGTPAAKPVPAGVNKVDKYIGGR